MTVVTSRPDFEALMILRMDEAKHLLALADWDGAYYLAGYAVEFALKIRIISELMKSNGFPDKDLARDFYKHDLMLLRRLAGLDADMVNDAKVAPHWDIVKDWSEQSRYEIGRTDKEAIDLLNAIENEVIPWIKARW
jgi:hypothetical protein